jgi:hypothetical protein
MTTKILKMPVKVAKKDPNQSEFPLLVDRQIDEGGLGMGVLSDGTPFLNQRGLALLCGVQNKYIGEISSEWNSPLISPRTSSIKAALQERDEGTDTPAFSTMYGNVKVLAYPDTVCMAILEHFAFEADWAGKAVAQGNYRRLARHGLRSFIYERVGYTPSSKDDLWKIFKDRVSLTYDAVPDGYFGVFKELSSLIVTLGLNGLHIDDSFVPDISVGQAWAKKWEAVGLSAKYGNRASYPHNYPPYFPQAASNPQMAACYPEFALGEFRRWFREEYIGEGRFRRYLTKKVSDKLLPDGYVERALLALTRE